MLKRDGEVQLVRAADGLVAVRRVRNLGRCLAGILQVGVDQQILDFLRTELRVVMDESSALARFAILAVSC